MTQISPIFKREFVGYFRTPVAYVFLVAFLVISVAARPLPLRRVLPGRDRQPRRLLRLLSLALTFSSCRRSGMRLWSEEKRSGTAELLFTLPVTTLEAVIGKFLAGWAFLALAVLLSFPMAITIGYLGNPDWGVVATSYLGSHPHGRRLPRGLLPHLRPDQEPGDQLRHQPVRLRHPRFPRLQRLHRLPRGLPARWASADAISNFSFITHFNPMLKGIVDPKDVIFFLSLMGFTLFLNVVVLER